MKKYITISAIIILAAISYIVFRDDRNSGAQPKGNRTNTGAIQQEDIQVVADNLNIPWEIAFLPNGDIIITERPGTLRIVGSRNVAISVPGVTQTAEGGLLGLVLHPDFENNNLLYVYYTTEQQGELQNRVERFRLDGGGLADRTTIIEGIPAAGIHNGGRIAFGPDGFLYITTGDAAEPDSAQNTNSLAGKILRLDRDGNVPADNPFNNPIYSYGHRNPQGLAWDNQNRLWATEHGPRDNDELNMIEKGQNYGWPVIQGSQARAGMRTPVANSNNDTWAPAGMAIINDNIYFGGLRGVSLFNTKPDAQTQSITRHFQEEFGRIRAVQAHEGRLYIATSNRDGRGDPTENDDRLISLNPEAIQ